MEPDVLPRIAIPTLERYLRVMPIVVVTGARQTGKSTLVRQLTGAERRYVTLDNLDVRAAARDEPDILVDSTQPLTLDEVQREPELLHAIKQRVDERRQPGQFLLTGSANLLMMNRVSESLAGRASYLNLWPMTRREQLGLGSDAAWEQLFTTDPANWIDILRARPSEPEDWRELARRGGYPVPVLQLPDPDDRAIWFEGYLRTYLERDLQDLANISALPDFRRLMRATCMRIGQLLNQSDRARDIAMTQPTAHRYLNLLETSHLLIRLPTFANNRTKRLIKSPKAFWSDTGLALHLSGETNPHGSHLENLVLHDLLTWRDSRLSRVDLSYWRTTTGVEVDFVIETSDAVWPIEVKSSSTPRLRDTRHLRTFLSEYSDISRAGLLLHCGEMLDWITPNVLAVPWWRVM